MTTSEWVLWTILIGFLILCVWEEHTVMKKDEELDDEMDYSDWLEDKYYHLAIITSLGVLDDYEVTNLIEYRRELWAEYYSETVED